MNPIKRIWSELQKYPTAVLGFSIILMLIGFSIYTVIAIPYQDAIRLWRGGEEIWYENPKFAPPAWINIFRKDKLSVTMIFNSEKDPAIKTIKVDTTGYNRITLTYSFDYEYDTYPQDLSVYFKSTFQQKNPHLSMVWITPDGRQIQVSDRGIKGVETYRIAQDEKLIRRLKGTSPVIGLFGDPNSPEQKPLKGNYQFVVTAYTFEPGTDVNGEFIIYGQAYGITGTDHQRRDLSVALMWGTPIALGFGLLAAIGTTVATMMIAAWSTWFGGWVDQLVQRITEVNMVLPFLPILLMISTFYNRSIVLILGVTVLLSIFGGGIKTYRSVFIQVKEAAFIEAAKAYGSSNTRIIFRYMVPRILPMLIPDLVVLIPSFVFLEASLAVLGLGDPILPTWGKIIDDAYNNGALYQGQYYWVLEPSLLLTITGFAFAMVGYALDRIFNPRLRGV